LTSIFQKQTVKQASILIAVITVSSQILGIVREAILASFFGTSAEYDILLIALAVPLMAGGIFFLAIPSAGIPYLQRIAGTGLSGGGLFRLPFVRVNSLLILSAAAIVFIVLPLFKNILASSLSVESADRVIYFGRIFCLLIPLRAFEAVFRSLLHFRHHFLFPAMAILGFNIVIISILLTLFPTLESSAFILAWISGTAVQTLLVVIPCWYFYRVRDNQGKSASFNTGGYLQYLGVIVLIESVSLLIDPFDRFICGVYLDAGYVSSVHYANIIYLVPIRVFIHSVATALFPLMAEKVANHDMQSLARNYHKSVALSILLIVPISVFMLIYRQEIISLLFERGAFVSESRMMTSEVLKYYLFGMFFCSVFFIQSKVFYALKAWRILIITRPLTLFVKVIIGLLLIKTDWAAAIGGGTTAMFMASFVIFEFYLVIKSGLRYSTDDLKLLLKSVTTVTLVTVVLVACNTVIEYIGGLNSVFSMAISGFAGFGALAVLNRLFNLFEINPARIFKSDKSAA